MERGYVLHHRPYRESSVLLNMLVDGVGRVDAVARLGSGKRSLKSILQPFQPLIFQLSGQSELKNLTQIEAASPAVPLSGDALYAGIYLNELLVRCLSVHHGGEGLFYAYHKTLMAMATDFCQSDLRYFELALLQELGCMPSLLSDVDDLPIDTDIGYRLLVDSGFCPLPANTAGYGGEMLIQLHNGKLAPEQLAAAKHLMRVLLRPLLGEKPLMSRQLFMQKRVRGQAKENK